MKQVIPISIWRNGAINCFLIRGKNTHILVDTGIPGSTENIIQQIKEHGLNPDDIGLIIITHSHIDHFGSAAKLKKVLKAPVLAHELDLEAYRTGIADISTLKPTNPFWNIFKMAVKNQKTKPFQPEIILKGNDVYWLKDFGINGKVIHTPGHTPGSLSVILDNGEGVIMDMLSTGIFLGGILFNWRTKHPAFHDSFTQLKQSLNNILEENTDTFYLGHGGPVNRKQVIKYLEKVKTRIEKRKLL